MAKKKSIGLPGGPNEYITDISEFLSIEGYKYYSDDVDNPINKYYISYLVPWRLRPIPHVEIPAHECQRTGSTQKGTTYL